MENDPVPSLLGLARVTRERRGEIAVRIMAGLAANPHVTDAQTGEGAARMAVHWADALEIELGLKS
jgi:hypothetical protein